MRIRTVKPEFHQSETLATLSREMRGFAAALLNWADDEGYFKSHPALIAGAIYPFDKDGQVFVCKCLEALQRIGYLQLGENRIARVVNFGLHQKINRPTPSRLRDDFGNPTETHNSVRTHGALTEDSGNVSLGSGKGSGTGKGNREAPAGAVVEAAALQALWNEKTSPPIPRCVELNDDRRKAAKSRLRDRPLPDWGPIFERINASAFCRGGNERGWLADFDFALRPGTAAKVLEGKYDDRRGQSMPRDLTRGVAEMTEADLKSHHEVGEIPFD